MRSSVVKLCHYRKPYTTYPSSCLRWGWLDADDDDNENDDDNDDESHQVDDGYRNKVSRCYFNKFTGFNMTAPCSSGETAAGSADDETWPSFWPEISSHMVVVLSRSPQGRHCYIAELCGMHKSFHHRTHNFIERRSRMQTLMQSGSKWLDNSATGPKKDDL